MTALVFYRASCPGDECDMVLGDGAIQRVKIERWKPSIFMPRVYSRLDLEVVSVRVERLHAIDDADAKREGAAYRIAPGGDLAGAFDHLPGTGTIGYREHFASLWREINGEESWDANPWVWRIEFRRDERMSGRFVERGGRERPILFSAPMVNAIISGAKTVTRRLVKPTVKGCTVGSYSDGASIELVNVDEDGDPVDAPPIAAPWHPGDRLWVKETFAVEHVA